MEIPKYIVFRVDVMRKGTSVELTDITDEVEDVIFKTDRKTDSDSEIPTSKIIEAYAKGWTDGAEAVKAIKVKALHKDYIEPYVTIEDEPQTEMTTEQIVNELLSLKKILDDGKMPKQTHDIRTETHECVKDTHDKTEPQTNGYQTFNGTSVYVSRLEGDIQTDNGIGCSRCEGRFDCYDRDMPNAVRCNNYGKVTDGKE